MVRPTHSTAGQILCGDIELKLGGEFQRTTVVGLAAVLDLVLHSDPFQVLGVLCVWAFRFFFVFRVFVAVLLAGGPIGTFVGVFPPTSVCFLARFHAFRFDRPRLDLTSPSRLGDQRASRG